VSLWAYKSPQTLLTSVELNWEIRKILITVEYRSTGFTSQRAVAHIPGANVIQCCGAAVRERRKRFEVRGWRQKVRMSNFKVQNPNDKIEMSNVKAQSSNGTISGRTEKRALSANQRFFRRVSGTKDCLRRFLQ
jgi:hypothetical protein